MFESKTNSLLYANLGLLLYGNLERKMVHCSRKRAV